MESQIVISTRMDKAEAKELDHFATEEALDRSSFVKKLIHKSLEQYKVEHAFKLYKEGKVSFGKAAELANKSIAEMISLMKGYKVYLNYSLEDLKKDLEMI